MGEPELLQSGNLSRRSGVRAAGLYVAVEKAIEGANDRSGRSGRVGDESSQLAATRRRRLMQWLGDVAVHPITLIALGSAIGGNLRYWLGRWIDERQWPGGIPWGTLVINVTGSLLLGFFAVWFLERLSPARRELYLLLGTGFCGGYTTFSTFEWETFKLVRDGNWPAALANAFGSLAVGFLGVVLGAMAAHLFFGRR